MIGIILLFSLAIAWMTFATVQDLKTREIANWLNFSLIIIALAIRFYFSLFSGEFWFFYQGILGLLIFFILANLFYYGRFFAGGDAKLMISLGAILPIYPQFIENVKLFVLFILIFFLVGAFYTIFSSIFISLKNFQKFKRGFYVQFLRNKYLVYFSLLTSAILMVFSFFEQTFIFLAALFFVLPHLYIYIKAVDESCLVKIVKADQLTEGDWLYRDVRVNKQMIREDWGGLQKEDIRKIKRENREIKIRYGIAFSPVFLITFMVLIYFLFTNLSETLWNFLWNSFW